MESDDLKKTVNILRELGVDWRENRAIMKSVAKGNRTTKESIGRLCKEGNQGSMIKIGLALVAFPLPIVVDDILGCSFLAAGLIQRKIKNSALYLEDINKAFPRLFKELQKINEDIV